MTLFPTPSRPTIQSPQQTPGFFRSSTDTLQTKNGVRVFSFAPPNAENKMNPKPNPPPTQTQLIVSENKGIT